MLSSDGKKMDRALFDGQFVHSLSYFISFFHQFFIVQFYWPHFAIILTNSSNCKCDSTLRRKTFCVVFVVVETIRNYHTQSRTLFFILLILLKMKSHATNDFLLFYFHFTLVSTTTTTTTTTIIMMWYNQHISTTRI